MIIEPAKSSLAFLKDNPMIFVLAFLNWIVSFILGMLGSMSGGLFSLVFAFLNLLLHVFFVGAYLRFMRTKDVMQSLTQGLSVYPRLLGAKVLQALLYLALIGIYFGALFLCSIVFAASMGTGATPQQPASMAAQPAAIAQNNPLGVQGMVMQQVFMQMLFGLAVVFAVTYVTIPIWIYLGIKLLFWDFMIVIGKKGIVGSLKSTIKHTSGSFWDILASLYVTMGVGFYILYPLFFLSFFFGSLATMLTTLISTFSIPLFYVYITMLYLQVCKKPEKPTWQVVEQETPQSPGEALPSNDSQKTNQDSDNTNQTR